LFGHEKTWAAPRMNEPPSRYASREGAELPAGVRLRRVQALRWGCAHEGSIIQPAGSHALTTAMDGRLLRRAPMASENTCQPTTCRLWRHSNDGPRIMTTGVMFRDQYQARQPVLCGAFPTSLTSSRCGDTHSEALPRLRGAYDLPWKACEAEMRPPKPKTTLVVSRIGLGRVTLASTVLCSSSKFLSTEIMLRRRSRCNRDGNR